MHLEIRAPDLFPKKRNQRQEAHDPYIRVNKGICPAIIAAALNITEHFVIQRQRKLGIRLLTGNPARRVRR